MTCPNCGGETTVVYCYADRESVQRKRQCNDCHLLFYTAEYECAPDRYRELQYENNHKRYLKKLKRRAKNAQSN